MTQLPTPEQLKELLLALPFADEALISSAITQEQLAMASATQEPLEELAAMSHCRNGRSHSRRTQLDPHHPKKWEDCPDNTGKKAKIKPWVRTRVGKMKVYFGAVLKKHFSGTDKDRSDRLRDLRQAQEAVKHGVLHHQIVNGEKRRAFILPFKSDGKEYTMKVVCVLKEEQWQVLTYHRYS